MTRLVTACFASYGVCWAVIEPLLSIVPDFEFKGTSQIITFASVSLLGGFGYFFFKHVDPTAISLILPGTNTRIQVFFGDLFAEEGCRVIGVNDFFDGEIAGNKIISTGSLHGIFIRNELNGSAEDFYKLVDLDLPELGGEVVKRAGKKRTRYPLGTVSLARHGRQGYFFVAISETDVETNMVSVDLPGYLLALQALWRKVREGAAAQPVAVPLLGTKLARLGLHEQQVLNLMILSLLAEAKKQAIPSEIRIVLHPSKAKTTSLRAIQTSWT